MNMKWMQTFLLNRRKIPELCFPDSSLKGVKKGILSLKVGKYSFVGILILFRLLCLEK